MTGAPVLMYYDPKLPVIVAADASSYGLGGVIYQLKDGERHPVAFASRTLLPSDRRYAQIEKECLASVWACAKFERYIVGLESFKLLTDHKPLVPLINDRDLDRVPLRCQRLLMRMMRFNPRAEYVKGSTLHVADTLSPHPVDPSTPYDVHMVSEIEAYVDQTRNTWPVTDDKMDQYRDATSDDTILPGVMQYTIDGWPQYHSDISEKYKKYHDV